MCIENLIPLEERKTVLKKKKRQSALQQLVHKWGVWWLDFIDASRCLQLRLVKCFPKCSKVVEIGYVKAWNWVCLGARRWNWRLGRACDFSVCG